MSILPSKMITGVFSQYEDFAYWFDTVPGPWDGYPYKWRVTISINAQAHSSDATPTPYYYDGLDVKVGDWIADSISTVKIVEIESQTSSQLIAIVEDIERYNTFNDPYQSGTGNIATGYVFIYELNENGMPVLNGVPTGIFGLNTASTIQSRFVKRNPTGTFITVLQTNHGFTTGDFIKVDETVPGRFELVSNSDVNLAIGVVTGIGVSGSNSFTFKPLGTLIENVEPALVGSYGDIFYLDPANPGKVTNVMPDHDVKPIYVRLDAENRAILLNISVDENTVPVTLNVVPTLDQTTFTFPAQADSVIEMAINGIETKNFTFDRVSKVLTFDPVANGYGLEPTDEVTFIYLS